MTRTSKILLSIVSVLSIIGTLCFGTIASEPVHAATKSGYAFVILSEYSKNMNIGDTAYLTAVASNGKRITYKSSKSSIVSVNTYGKLTAKKSGSAVITAKVTGGEASCRVTVNATGITLSNSSFSLYAGYSARLSAYSTTGHGVTFRSSKSSIATVDASGRIYAKKPGTASITVSCDGSSATCKVTVKSPTVSISNSSIGLYRNQSVKLSYTSTSRNPAKWKSSKSSVATVDAYGNVRAVKHGTATISVTVDGVTKSCTVTVNSPTIRINAAQLTLDLGQTYHLTTQVSSGNPATFSSSNTNVVTVSANGTITAKRSGKAYVYAKEDGAKESVLVFVR